MRLAILHTTPTAADDLVRQLLDSNVVAEADQEFDLDLSVA